MIKRKQKPDFTKYRSIQTTVDGHKFPSKKEANRYRELKLMQLSRDISDLRLQVSYTLTVNGVHVCRYVADFVYIEDGQEIVEDVKGFLTKEYKLKRKLMKAIYNIVIRET